MKKISFIFIITLFLPFLIHSTTPVDSLVIQLNQLEKDQSQEKIKLLTELSLTFRRINADSALHYAQTALDLSKKIDYKLGEAKALKNIGIAFDIKGLPDSSLVYMNHALQVSEYLKDNYLISRNLNNLGLAYQKMGGYELSIEYYLKSLAISELSEDPIRGVTLMNLGLLEQRLTNYNEALEYYLRALEIARIEKNSIHAASCLYNIGGIYRAKKSHLVALDYFRKAQNLAEENKDNLLLGKIFNSIGRISADENDIVSAERFFKEGLKSGSKAENNQTISESWLELAKLDKKANRIPESIQKAKKGLIIAETLNAKSTQIRLLRLLADNYAQQDDYKSAFTFEQEFFQVSDMVFNKEKSKKLNALHIQRQISKKEAEVAILTSLQEKNEAIIEKQSTRLAAFLAGFILLCFISIILYRLIKTTRDQNKVLEMKVAIRTAELQQSNMDLRNSNQELERFAFITSHDLKEPLRNITGFTNLLERKLGKDLDDEGKTFIRFVQRSTKQMHQLIEDVLQFSTIGKELNKIEQVNTTQIMEKIKKDLSEQASIKKAKISFTDLPQLQGNSDYLYIILKNLVDNAIKYNKSDTPTVAINAKIIGKEAIFSVKDNGIGIAPEFHEQIFMMFKRLHNRQDYMGSGLGLALVKKLVEKMNGKIWIKSDKNVGSIFYFSLPLLQDHKFISNIDIPLEMAN